MTELTDVELLRRFRDSRAREPLDVLVRRYIGLVHAAAIRQVRDPHLAADITQAVFIVLVRRADSLRPDTVLSSWLFTVTRHAVANARRVSARRTFHEQQRAMMTSPRTDSSAETDMQNADEIRSLLDDAIARLGHVERSSVLLHFFGQKSHRQVGEALGMSEDAARKRVSRALDRLREIVAERSGRSSTSIASILAIEGAAAAQFASHASLVSSTVNVALLANSIATPTSAAALIAKGVSHMLTLSKIKVAAAAGLALLVVGGAVTPVVIAARRSAAPIARPQVSSFVETHIASHAAAPATQPSFIAQVSEKTKLEFAGVNNFPPDPDGWWAINGEPMEFTMQMPDGRHVHAEPPPKHLLAVKVSGGTEAMIARIDLEGAMMSANMMVREDDSMTMLCAFTLQDESKKTVTLHVGVTDSDWKTLASNEKPTEASSGDGGDLGTIEFTPIEANDQGEGCKVTVEHANEKVPQQIVAVDEAGKEHKSSNINMRSDGQHISMTCTFDDVTADKVKKVLFQTRAINKFVDATEISLEKGTITKPKIEVRDPKASKDK